MKNIHLFLGFQVAYNKGAAIHYGHITGIGGNGATVILEGANVIDNDDTVKPIGRRLEDMTEAEARYIYKMYWEKDYDDASEAHVRAICTPVQAALRIIEGYDFTTGAWSEVLNLVPQLLEWRFDIWNLIDAKKMIDIKTLK